MARRDKLSDLQCKVGQYLLACMNEDGTCVFDSKDLSDQVDNAYPYNVFRQFVVKGLIDELPTRNDDGLYRVHIANVQRFAGSVTNGKVSFMSSNYSSPSCSSPNHNGYTDMYLDALDEEYSNCEPDIGVNACIHLHLDAAKLAIDSQILNIVLSDNIDDEDEEALRQLVVARKTMRCGDMSLVPECVLVLSYPNCPVGQCDRDEPRMHQMSLF